VVLLEIKPAELVKAGYLLETNEEIYIDPVKTWTSRYAPTPEVLRLRPITSALSLNVRNPGARYGKGYPRTYKVAGRTRTSQ
jgi:hypothetical protein